MIWIIATGMALLLAADRASKIWAYNSLRVLPGGLMDVLPGIVGLRYAENTGAAFSRLSGNVPLLALLTAALIVSVSAFAVLNRRRLPRRMQYALWIVVAGGLGNLYDRILYGYVIDFIEFQFMRFAIFNVADMCVSLGALGVCLMMFIGSGRDQAKS